MRNYRVGIIGCGNIANAHAKAYLKLGLRIVAACDIDNKKLTSFKERYGVKRTYVDYNKMLKREELDIVSICTWPTLHCEMTIAAAEAGAKGIFCEKPMALNLKEADMMLEACRKAGSKLLIGHIRRYMTIYNKAKEIVTSGIVGEVTFIHGMTVGDLMSDGTHLIDLVRFIIGDRKVRWVFGQVDLYEKRKRYGHYVEDAAIGYFEFENNVRAFIEVSQLTGSQVSVGNVGFTKESIFKDLARAQKINWWRGGVKYCTIHVMGTEGRVEVGEWEKPKIKYKGKGDSDWRSPLVKERDPFVEEVRDLIRSIEEDTDPLSSGEQARNTLEVIMAIYESAYRREVTLLPLEIDYNPLFVMIEGGASN